MFKSAAAFGLHPFVRMAGVFREIFMSMSMSSPADYRAEPRGRDAVTAERPPMEHAIDCAPDFFQLFVGDRPATEIRHHHAVYRVGDHLRIRERVTDDARARRTGAPYYTGRECVRVVVDVKPWNRRTGLVELTLDDGRSVT